MWLPYCTSSTWPIFTLWFRQLYDDTRYISADDIAIDQLDDLV